MNNKITILTVVKNLIKDKRKDYFQQMVASVQKQTYKNIEHIVIDGMSDDSTLELLEEYKQKGLITYYQQQDTGPYDAMNKAIKKYAGEYLVLLHSDDYLYDQNALEMQMKYMEMTNSDYVTGDTVFIDSNNKEIFPYFGIAHNSDPSFYFLKGDNTPVFWIETSYNHEGMLFKKSAFEAVGYFSNEKFYGTSTDFKFEFDLIINDLKHVHIPYNILCFRTGGVSSHHDPRFYNILEYMYSKFYFLPVSDLTEYDRLRQHPNKLFIFGLKSYLTSLNLKNFNYKDCFDFLDKLLQVQTTNGSETLTKSLQAPKSRIHRYRLLGLPFMKVKTDDRGSKHYKLFWILPVLKIKTDSKGGKTYKLFSFLPLWNVKAK